MSRRVAAVSWLMLLLTALVLAQACAPAVDSQAVPHRPFGVDLPPALNTFYVQAGTGSDTLNDGKSAASPFLTLTHAASLAVSAGDRIQLAPGTYLTGETFPIVLHPGVQLVGDPTSRGAGGTPTLVEGCGQASDINVVTTIEAAPSATITGLTVFNNGPCLAAASYTGIFVPQTAGQVVIQANTLQNTSGSGGFGIIIDSAGANVASNTISNNDTGIGFFANALGALVQGNDIVHNVTYGVSDATDGEDYGSLSLSGSPGGNSFSCNGTYDLFVTVSSSSTISAQFNKWDNNPPLSSSLSTLTNDFFTTGPAVDAASSNLAPSPCPYAQPDLASLFVDNSIGSDVFTVADGSSAHPFRTITHAMQVVAGLPSGSRTVQVNVGSGSYDRTTGETFPIHIAGSTRLQAASSTIQIFGCGSDSSTGSRGAAIVMEQSSLVDSFDISPLASDCPSVTNRIGVLAANDSTVQETHIHDSHTGIEASGAAQVQIVSNFIEGSLTAGVAILNTATAVVDNNSISGNILGVSVASPNADLGGGTSAQPSTGNNVFRCNNAGTTGGNVRIAGSIPAGTVIPMVNNSWDNATPLTGHGSTGNPDIDFPLTAPPDYSQFTQAGGGCPTAHTPITIFVDGTVATSGDGSSGAPFKTITEGLNLAQAADTIQVPNVTHTFSAGEIFPMHIPPGVTLLGAEIGAVSDPNTGGASGFIKIQGCGADGSTASAGYTFVPEQDSTLIGFWVDTGGCAFAQNGGVLITKDNVTIRSNIIQPSVGNGGIQIHIVKGTGIQILHNDIQGGSIAGMQVDGGSTFVQTTTFANSVVGVSIGTPNIDLGSGFLGSPGNNTFSCNFPFNVLFNSNLGSSTATIDLDNAQWNTTPSPAQAPSSSATTHWDYAFDPGVAITPNFGTPRAADTGCATGI